MDDMDKLALLTLFKEGRLSLDEVKARLRGATPDGAAVTCFGAEWVPSAREASVDPFAIVATDDPALAASGECRAIEGFTATAAAALAAAVARAEESSVHRPVALELSLSADRAATLPEQLGFIAQLARSSVFERCSIVIGFYGRQHRIAAAAVAGLANVLVHERPAMALCVVHADAGTAAACMCALRTARGATGGAREVRVDGDDRQRRAWRACEPVPGAPVLRRGGVYLISGGAGGIGLELAAWLHREHDAVVVLCGRSHPADARRERLRALAPAVSFVEADVADREQVQQLVAGLLARHGRLHGVFHLAGVLADEYVVRSDARHYARTLAPKLAGAQHLHEATSALALDCFVLFSSLATLFPNEGQAAYAAANRAMAAFGAARAAQAEAGACHGRTRVLHWPLWAVDGMQMNDAVRSSLGIQALPAPVGLNLLDQVLRSEQLEAWIAWGRPEAAMAALDAVNAAPRRPAVASDAMPAIPALSRTSIETLLGDLLHEITGFERATLHPARRLDELALDSILVHQLNVRLAARFRDVSRTVFYEYRDIAALACHLAGKPQVPSTGAAQPDDASAPEHAVPARPPSPRHPVATAGSALDIAVIGYAGVFPRADSCSALAARLRAGDDCIAPYPAARAALPGCGLDGIDAGWDASGGFIDGIELFDPFFFGLSPRDADYMDPQERLFLQTGWHALEHAGMSVERLHACSGADDANGVRRHRAGVYVGISGNQYSQLIARSGEAPLVRASQPNVWSLANRVSYFLDLHGPSLTIDTACSSSMAALHQACRALADGSIDHALVGGVSLNVDPARGLVLDRAHMLATDRRCRSFGAGGDGFVPGEGVVAVLLKPLALALRDGDVVHGVIDGCALNHGGRTSGYTVPSPLAQASSIAAAWREAGVAADAIGCLEAHGTGTALGDPIEMTGLGRALAAVAGNERPARAHCAIGSIKSNLGHLEAAAALAGVVKALLQLRDRQRYPSLHADRTNPNIDFQASAFRVQTQLADWPAPAPGIPRAAGISSFGAGGTNGHVLLREYVGPQPAEARASATGAPELLTYSAATPSRLRAVVRAHIAWLEADASRASAPRGFAQYAHLLRCGREHLAARLAVIATDRDAALRALHDFLDGAPCDSWREGRISDAPEHARKHSDVQTLQSRASGGGAALLAEDWLGNVDHPWHALHPEAGMHGVDLLPRYPFEPRRCWFAPLAVVDADLAAVEPWRLQATADGRSVSVTLHLDHPVLAHHVIRGERLLAGTAQLALARAAAVAAGLLPATAKLMADDVVLVRPLRLEAGADTAEIVLRPESDALSFELRRDEIVSRGTLRSRAVPGSAARARVAWAPEGDALSGEQLYAALDSAGFAYGPSYRGVRRVWLAGTACHVELEPAYLARESDLLVPFHPGIVDAILQALAVFHGSEGVLLPYGVASVRQYAATSRLERAVARALPGSGADRRFDVFLLDSAGDVVLEYIGLHCRHAAPVSAPQRLQPQPLFVPAWESVPWRQPQAERWDTVLVFAAHDAPPVLAAIAHHHAGTPLERIAFDARVDEQDVRRLLETHAGRAVKLYVLPPMTPDDADLLDAGVVARTLDDAMAPLHRVARTLFRVAFERLALDVVCHDVAAIDGKPARNAFQAMLIGYCKTLDKELRDDTVRLIDVAGDEIRADTEAFERLLGQGAVADTHCALRGGSVYTCTYVAASSDDAAGAGTGLRQRGVYVIAGGAGGLGRITAEWLMSSYDADVVLLGRASREAPPAIGAGSCRYIRADIDDPNAVRAAIRAVRAQFGRIDGAFHSALVLEDRSISRMDEDCLRRVLAPKTTGLAHFAAALCEAHVDLLVLYSSAIAQSCTPGQANYAAASTFEDAYGLALATRFGRTQVINWGYWSEVGIVSSAVYRDAFSERGIRGLTIADGLAILASALAGRQRQVITGSNADATSTRGPEMTQRQGGEGPPAELDSAWRRLSAGLAPAADDAHVLQECNALVHRLLLAHLQAHGLLVDGGVPYDTDQALRQLGVAPHYAGLFRAIEQILLDAGFLNGEAGAARVAPDVPRVEEAQALAALARFEAARAQAAAMLRLVRACVGQLVPVATGRMRYTQVMFPGGSNHLLEPIYKDDPVSAALNRLLAEGVVSHLRQQANGRVLHVLEVGAGTGGTSGHVLDALSHAGIAVEYHYTDVSPHFLKEAERAFAAYPCMRYGVLDIERPPEPQGFAPGMFDVVIATNVLHATSDVVGALRRIAGLLDGAGLLAINESIVRQDAVTLTFGLASGWWLARDAERRIPHSPLLAPSDWRDCLALAGFAAPRTYGEAFGQMALFTSPAPRAVALDLIARNLAELQKVPRDEIDADTAFERYGVDSIVALDLLSRLETVFGKLPGDLIFEHNTPARLADWLVANRPGVAAAAPEDGDLVAISPASRDLTPREPLRDDRPAASTPHARTARNDVAIVGYSLRVAGAADADTFWQLLCDERDVFRAYPTERLPYMAGSAPEDPEPAWGAYIDAVDCFDSLLFGISPREAERMDPQERILLEQAWHALEDAGYTPARLHAAACARNGAGVGVFAGAMYGHYQLLAADRWARGEAVAATSNYYALSNNISRCFGFTGPSITMDGACASALTCLHMAVRAIAAGDCAAALVGGVNLILHPSHLAGLRTMRMLSPAARCRLFSANGDGFVAGEGAGVLVLRPLADAQRDRDCIHAVVRASAINSNGSTMQAAPNRAAHEEVMRRAWDEAGLAATDIDYVEVQAMGSSLGDRVEFEALAALTRTRPPASPLPIGSIKPSIGHLEAASGIAQVVKTLLQFRHGSLPPTLGLDDVDPALRFVEAGLEAVARAQPWPPRADRPRRIGIDSFGAGGSNAHVVLEEWLGNSAAETLPEPAVLVLPMSARKDSALREMAGRLTDWLDAHPHAALAELCFTYQVGRASLPQRLCVVFSGRDELLRALSAHARGEEPRGAGIVAGRAHSNADVEPVDGDLRALARSEAEQLARRWCAGAALDWSSGYPGGLPGVVQAPQYPFERVRHWFGTIPAPMDAPSVPAAVAATAASEAAVSEPAASQAAVSEAAAGAGAEAIVVSNVARILGLRTHDVDLDCPISDFGFDSITLTELIAAIVRDHDVPIDATVLFEHGSLGAFARHLGARWPHAFAAPGTSRSDSAPGSASPAPVPAPGLAVVQATEHAGPAVAALTEVRAEDVAVIGMHGRFPGSADLASFWAALCDGEVATTGLPRERSETLGLYRLSDAAAPFARFLHGCFIEGIDLFDPLFFRIAPAEARAMEPQQRLLLEAAWATVEDAGYDPRTLAGSSTGVFVGVADSGYGELVAADRGDTPHSFTSTLTTMYANRISYVLGLEGPSEPINTACSSSLVAVHRAVRALRARECDLALAGGVSLLLSAFGFVSFGFSGMLAADGRCKSFDDAADGYVRGEGLGMVLLKPLAAALRDGDRIDAVVRGSSVRHNGQSVSITAPNVPSQVALIRDALRDAGVGPGRIGFVEAHGTGTELGDPIEINALRAVFQDAADGVVSPRCAIGTVKANIGHLEPAAGIAGFIKTVLCLRHKHLPPLATLRTPNRRIHLQETPLYLLDRGHDWQAPRDGAGRSLSRMAGVSSFGIGGVLAHVVLEEADAYVAQRTAGWTTGPAEPHPIVLSARSAQGLMASVAALLQCLQRAAEAGRDVDLHDLSMTLLLGRCAAEHRLAFIAGGTQEVRTTLQRVLDGAAPPGVERGHDAGEGMPALLAEAGGAEALQAAVAGHLQARRLSALIGLWSRGVRIDWRSLWPAAPFRRVQLPGQPFERASYWIRLDAVATTTGASAGAPMPLPESDRVPPAPTEPVDAVPAHAPEPRMPSRREATVLSALIAIFSDVLQIPAFKLKADVDIASYGVDSLSGLRLNQRMQKAFGEHITIAAIQHNPTLAQLASHIAAAQPGTPPQAEDAQPSQPASVAPEAPEAPMATLVECLPLADGADNTPLVLLCAETGELAWAMHLLEGLADGQRAIGLEAASFMRNETPQFDYAQWVDAAADAVLRASGPGVLRLAAVGSMSRAAIDVALRLRDAGCEVERIHAYLPEGMKKEVVPACRVAALYAELWEAPMPALPLPAGDAAAEALAAWLEAASAPIPADRLQAWSTSALRHAAHFARVVPRLEWARTDGLRVEVCAPPAAAAAIAVEAPHAAVFSAAGTGLLGPGAAPVRPWFDAVRQRAMEEAPEARIVLNVLSEHPGRPRLYCLPTLYGDVHYAAALAMHLGDACAVSAFQQLGDDRRPALFDSVEALAGACVDRLLAADPAGPYALCGISFGGVIAFEMARQLSARGRKVAHLIVLDAYMPNTAAMSVFSGDRGGQIEMVGRHLFGQWSLDRPFDFAGIDALEPDPRIERMAEHLYRHSQRQPGFADAYRLVQAHLAIEACNQQALDGYRAAQLPNDIGTLFVCANRGFYCPPSGAGDGRVAIGIPMTEDRTKGFGDYIEHLHLREIHTDHLSLPQHLDVCAREIAAFVASPAPARAAQTVRKQDNTRVCHEI